MMPMQKSIRDTAPYDTEESLGLAYLTHFCISQLYDPKNFVF